MSNLFFFFFINSKKKFLPYLLGLISLMMPFYLAIFMEFHRQGWEKLNLWVAVPAYIVFGALCCIDKILFFSTWYILSASRELLFSGSSELRIRGIDISFIKKYINVAIVCIKYVFIPLQVIILTAFLRFKDVYEIYFITACCFLFIGVLTLRFLKKYMTSKLFTLGLIQNESWENLHIKYFYKDIRDLLLRKNVLQEQKR